MDVAGIDTAVADYEAAEETVDEGPVEGEYEKYPTGENGYPILEGLQLTTFDQLELIDGFLANRFGSEYLSAKLAIAHKRNSGE